jgi:hypothetical protein
MTSKFQFKKKLYYMRKEEYELELTAPKKMTIDQVKSTDFNVKMLDTLDVQAAGNCNRSLLGSYNGDHYGEDDEEEEGKYSYSHISHILKSI